MTGIIIDDTLCEPMTSSLETCASEMHAAAAIASGALLGDVADGLLHRNTAAPLLRRHRARHLSR